MSERVVVSGTPHVHRVQPPTIYTVQLLPHVTYDPPLNLGVAREYVPEKNCFNVELSDGRSMAFRPLNLTWLNTVVANDSLSSDEDGNASGVTVEDGHAEGEGDGDGGADGGSAELGGASSGSESEIEVHSDYDSDFTEEQIAGRRKMVREAKLAFTRATAAKERNDAAEAAKNMRKAANLGHAEAQVPADIAFFSNTRSIRSDLSLYTPLLVGFHGVPSRFRRVVRARSVGPS